MGVESGPHARALAQALAALRAAANKAVTKPTLARIVTYCAQNGVKISDTTVSDWLTGKAVPTTRQEFELLVRCLNGYATRGDTSYEPLSPIRWEQLRYAATEERRRAQGERRSRPAASTALDHRAELLTSLHAAQVRESIAPLDELRDREREIKMLAEFCRSDGPPYLWIQGVPWAGKSALLSSFALDPPPDITVVSFFITDRRAGQNDHAAFTASLLDQLAILLPEHKTRVQDTVLNRDGLRNELLTLAARREADHRRRLVLVVDGLDEDTGTHPIVKLLPARPQENLRVVVASRHGPRLPIPHGHPLTHARRYPLSESEFAAGIRDLAVDELDALLDGPEPHRELLALITAADGLSVSELETLTRMAPFEIDRLLRRKDGRSFRGSTPSPAARTAVGRVFALAHKELAFAAADRLGGLLPASLDRLHAWADEYRDRGWPTDTPDFLLHRYFTVLERHDDMPRMITLALSRERHERLHASTGGDWAALTEIGVVQQRICEQPDPNLLTTARLARRRDQLHQRNAYIPVELVAVRARLGQTERAEALARSIPRQWRRALALAEVARVMAPTDPERAARLGHQAADLVEEHINIPLRDDVLARAAEAIAVTDPDRAEIIAHRIADRPMEHSQALARLSRVLEPTDSGRADQLADRAEIIADDITDLQQRAAALAWVAEAIAQTDPDRAVNIADRAEAAADDITDPQKRALVLAWVAKAIARTDPDRAVNIADRAEPIADDITDPQGRALMLGWLAEAIVATEPERARQIAGRAEAAAKAITEPLWLASRLEHVFDVILASDPDRAEIIAQERNFGPEQQASALARLAAAIVATDPERAGQLADHSEAAAKTITEPLWRRADQLTSLASSIAPTDPNCAGRIADDAVTAAEAIPDPAQRTNVLSRAAAVIALTDARRAEDIADKFTSPLLRTKVLQSVAEVVAWAAPGHAGRIAERAEAAVDDITDPEQRAPVLAWVAKVIKLTDPGRGGQIAERAFTAANNITEQWQRTYVLDRIAEVIAAIDPNRAETIANADRRPETFARIAREILPTDSHRAGQLAERALNAARDIDIDQGHRTHVLERAIEVIASIDPHRAETITSNITDPRERDRVLQRIAEVIAATDPNRAETIANTITDPQEQADILLLVAKAIAPAHPQRAKTLLAKVWAASSWDRPLSVLQVVDSPLFEHYLAAPDAW